MYLSAGIIVEHRIDASDDGVFRSVRGFHVVAEPSVIGGEDGTGGTILGLSFLGGYGIIHSVLPFNLR